MSLRYLVVYRRGMVTALLLPPLAVEDDKVRAGESRLSVRPMVSAEEGRKMLGE